jgi:hypothetical protein
MNREDATMAVGYLVGATTGWNDEAVIVYINEIEQLSDVEALNSAIRHLVSTWTEARRPPVATILDAYRSELSKRNSRRPSIESPRHRVVPVHEGIEIARRAYEDECRRQGREPNIKHFDKVVGITR